MLRNDESARLNDPSDSVFILEMSDCEVVSFVAIVVMDRDFDPLEDKCLTKYDVSRGVMPMLGKL